MHIGIAAKDIMAANAISPIAERIARMGNKVTAFLEGKAIDAFAAKECGRVIVGPTDQPEKMPWYTDDLSSFFTGANRLNALLVGASSPIRCEYELAKLANEAHIPVIASPDLWGAENRLKDARVDLWFAIDAVHESMLKSRGGRVVLIGSPLYEKANRLPTKDERARLSRYGEAERMVLVVGQKREFLPDLFYMGLALLRGSVEQQLVLRWHPKIPPDPSLEAQFRRELAVSELADRVVSMSEEDAKVLTTDILATLCGTTISAYSNTLLVAAGAGNRAISVHSKKSVEGMQEETNLSYFPPSSPPGPIVRYVENPSFSMAPVWIGKIPRGKYKLVPRNLDLAAFEIIKTAR